MFCRFAIWFFFFFYSQLSMMSCNLQLCYFLLGTLVCFACLHNVKTPERNDDCGDSCHASVMCAASRPRTHATADGAAPLAAPLAQPRGVPPSPTLPWAGAGQPHPRTRTRTRAAACIPAAHRTCTRLHTLGALPRVRTAAHRRSGALQHTHARTAAPSRAHAHPAHRCGG